MMRIAIIAACGKSSRTGLGEYTTKAAFPLQNRPLIAHQIDFLRRSKVDRIFIVARPEHARVLGTRLSQEERQGVAFVLAEPGIGWAGTVERAVSFVGPEDEVILISCDNYHTAAAVERLNGFDSLFTYTSWNREPGPTNGPVLGRRMGESLWQVQSGARFKGEFFTGYVVARGEVLLSGLRDLSPSERGEKEIASLLEMFTRFSRCKIVPYGGEYEDVADLPGLARLDAKLVGDVDLTVPTEIGAGVLLHGERGVFLAERQDGRGWTIPGGLVEEGETYAEAAARELEEEIGIVRKSEALRLLGIYPSPSKRKGPALSVIFHATAKPNEKFRVAKSESHRVAWFTKDEASKVTIPFNLGKAVKDHFEGRELDTR